VTNMVIITATKSYKTVVTLPTDMIFVTTKTACVVYIQVNAIALQHTH